MLERRIVTIPDVKPNVTYTVTFSSQEFRLVTRALAGLIRGGKEENEAQALNVVLLRVRSAYINDLKKVVDAALENAETTLDEEGQGATDQETT